MRKEGQAFWFARCWHSLSMEGRAPTDYLLVDNNAAKVIEKYQTSTCEQLQAQKEQPKEPPCGMKAKAIDILRKDPPNLPALPEQSCRSGRQ